MALGFDEDAPSFPLALFSSSFLWLAAALTFCLAASIFAKKQRACIRNADGKKKTNGDGRKYTYLDESIRPICELQASVLGPRNMNEEC